METGGFVRNGRVGFGGNSRVPVADEVEARPGLVDMRNGGWKVAGQKLGCGLYGCMRDQELCAAVGEDIGSFLCGERGGDGGDIEPGALGGPIEGEIGRDIR